jgi:alpha-beta hydrolase superfamily lysophospholipase
MRRLRDANMTLPTEVASAGGLAYSLWLPDPGAAARRGTVRGGTGTARGGVVILHGAGSVKESHHDFARVLVAAGFGAIVFDQRGHGESTGPMDDTVLADIAAMAALLRERLDDPDAPLALRGSSMGGYFAIVAAPGVGARAVVAICPASDEGLRRGLAAGKLPFEADLHSLDGFWASHDIGEAVDALQAPVLLLHAEGDEVVPVAHSRELATRLRHPSSRLIALPGGHHRSIQHDDELQAVSLKFIAAGLAAG